MVIGTPHGVRRY